MLKLRPSILNKTYRGRKVVDDVELEIGQGEVVGCSAPMAQARRLRFISW